MKIAMTHPFCWPHVRRGTERNIEILSDWLAGRNHDVTLISSWEGAEDVEKNGRRTRILKKRISSPILERLHVYPQHTFFFTSYGALSSLDADVLHSFFYTDALAGSMARGSRGYRTVLQLNGIAIPGVSTRRFPPEAWMLRKAIEKADVEGPRTEQASRCAGNLQTPCPELQRR
jgi:phosphatidylinositol alpha-mannosyltransferase